LAYRGKSLRAVRERKNIELKRISDTTRITLWYLNAIEEERFEAFPGRFYFKSFTGEYARSLGLDPGEVLQDLQGAYDEWCRENAEDTHTSEAATANGFFTRFTGRFRKPPEV
jgi:cytoskeletal protein RodZ